jgi:hypothetical protein
MLLLTDKRCWLEDYVIHIRHPEYFGYIDLKRQKRYLNLVRFLDRKEITTQHLTNR